MARPLTWLDRIVPIARAVAQSARSHYAREDLQELFEIQPRSAQNLMSAMPVVSIGNAHLVERESLITLLRKLNEAEDPTKAFAFLRSKRVKPVTRKLRSLSLTDVATDLDAPPENLTMSRGEITVRFKSVDQLAEGMLYLAYLLRDRLDNFAILYEPLSQLASDGADSQEELPRATTFLRE